MSKSMSLPDWQKALMGLSPENQQKFYSERDKFLAETVFEHALPENFDHYRFFIGCHTNEVTLGINADTYTSLFFTKSFEQYSYGNMTSICQGSEMVSFFMYVQSFGKKEGVNTTAEWCYMRKAFEVLTNQVNSFIEPYLIKMVNGMILSQQSIVKGGNYDTGNYKAGKQIIALP